MTNHSAMLTDVPVGASRSTSPHPAGSGIAALTMGGCATFGNGRSNAVCFGHLFELPTHLRLPKI
jgi:hypothetical protein